MAARLADRGWRIRFAGGALGLAVTSACGSAPPPAAPPPSSAAPVTFGPAVPANPGSGPMWTAKQRGVTTVVAGPGVISLLTTESGGGDGSIVTLDAVTGRPRWTAPTSNTEFLASDTTGPALGPAGVVVAADDVEVPQEGLTPASLRTDIVAREAGDGHERWRVEVLRQPVDKQSPDRVLSLVVQGDTVAVVMPRRLAVLETASGRQRWQSQLDLPEELGSLGLGWTSLAIGPDDVAASARLPGQSAQLVTFDRTTGRARWRDTARSPDDQSTPTFGRVQVTIGRVLVETMSTSATSARTSFLSGYALKDGTRVWRSAAEEGFDTASTVLDRADGTAIRTVEGGLTAINIQNGKVRWRQPKGVKADKVQAADGMTYLIGTSGDDRQVIALRTRTGEQTAVLPGEDATDVAIFAGAVAVVSNDGVALHR